MTIVSTYLESGKFGGFRNSNNIPDGFFVANAQYPNNLIDGYYNQELNQWYENASEEEIRSLTVPTELSRMKFKMQIRRSTYYSYEIIVAYIENMTVSELFTEDMKQDILDRLHDCVKFERYSPDFIKLANMMNVSDAIKDEIFIEGNKIE